MSLTRRQLYAMHTNGDVNLDVDHLELPAGHVNFITEALMRNGSRWVYWLRQAARWFVKQLALTLGSVSRRELFLRLFIVGLGIGMLIAVRARM